MNFPVKFAKSFYRTPQVAASKIVKNTFFYRTPPLAASVSLKYLSFVWQGFMGEGGGGGNSDRTIFIFSVLFCEFDSMLQPNFEKDKLLRFDGIDLSKELSKS